MVQSNQQEMSTSITRSASTVEGAEQPFEALNRAVAQIQRIHAHISLVATAAKEPSTVSDTINQSLPDAHGGCRRPWDWRPVPAIA